MPRPRKMSLSEQAHTQTKKERQDAFDAAVNANPELYRSLKTAYGSRATVELYDACLVGFLEARSLVAVTPDLSSAIFMIGSESEPLGGYF